MPKIKIYTTPACVYCKSLKSYLDEHDFKYEAIDVSTDKAAAEEMIEKSGQMGVPVSVITMDDGKEEILVGFNQEKVAEILGIK